MLTFEYELLIFSPKLETSYEEEDKGNINGAGPSGTIILEEEPGDLKRGKDSPKKEASSETYASKQILKSIKFAVQEVTYQEHAYAST